MRQLVRLNTPNSQGQTRRQTLEASRKMMEKAGKDERYLDEFFSELKPVELAAGTEHLLAVFDDLSSARGNGMSGPLPVPYVEIQAYCTLMDEQLTGWEVDCLRIMDNAYLEEAHKLCGTAQH